MIRIRLDYFLTVEGKLSREGGTIYFENESTKRAIPVDKVNAIYAFKNISMSGGAIALLGRSGIPVHFFGWYGNYEGTFWPKESLVSGEMVVRQCEHYLDPELRMALASEFVRGSLSNINRNLSRYVPENEQINDYIELIRKEIENTKQCMDIAQLMGCEGRARDAYYMALDELLPDEFKIGTRGRRPPSNMGNALVSFCNSLVYSAVLTEIYRTHLHPAISFLHEPRERRFSLSLDVAEIFKPILADRVILKVVRKKMIAPGNFESDPEGVLLNDQGKKIITANFNEKLDETITHRGLGRNVSYRRLVRIELYKLEQHLLGGKRYKSLVMWW